MNAEERIEKLEARVKELEAREAINIETITKMNYTIGLILEIIENSVNLID